MSFPSRMKKIAKNRSGGIVFPEGTDERIREAASSLIDKGILEYALLLGEDQKDLKEGLYAVAIEESKYYSDVKKLLSEELDDMNEDKLENYVHNPLFFAAALIEIGAIEGMVAGACHPTSKVLRAAINIIGTRDGEDVVSSSFVMETSKNEMGSNGNLIFSDPAVLPSPDPDELVDVAYGAVQLYQNLIDREDPKVAFLSFSTRGSANHELVDKIRAASNQFETQHPSIISDGELQADAALVNKIAERKAPDSPVNGNANILVFPDLNAANIAYKLVQWIGDAGAYGPFLQGLNGVVNDLSRGCSVSDIETVASVSLVQAT